MVVILIIGLLVSVVMPNLDFIWGDAQIRKAKIDVKQIHEAASLYPSFNQRTNRRKKSVISSVQINSMRAGLIKDICIT